MNCQTFKDTNPEDKELRWLFRNNNIFFFFFFRRETRYFWCYDNDCYFYLIINMTTISYFYLIINMYKIKIITCNENSYVI